MSDAETYVSQAATQAQEIEVIGRVQVDLIARNAYYHESSRRNLLVKAKRRMQAVPKEDSNAAKKKAAYEDAFSHVYGYVKGRNHWCIPSQENDHVAGTAVLFHAGETSGLLQS